ncbi:aminoglycoside phosphotransferase family protein [Alphaproteobacteria bacterium]|nr:aminoglycoside phosphotransferase family protein [Alphaproteobacteria bacterium]
MKSEIKHVEHDILVTLGLKGQGIQPIRLGANNKSYTCHVDEQLIFVKYFLKDSADERDKIGAEWEFLRYLDFIGEEQAPKPIAINTEKNLLIIGHCHGDQPAFADYSNSLVSEASLFINRINRDRINDWSQTLPLASEHTPSISGYNKLTKIKLDALNQSIPKEEHEARLILDQAISLLDALWSKYEGSNSAVPDCIAKKNLCISPSDFGFHNVLVTADGRVNFVDFEYAGWDDPAKLLCDFVLHPAMKLNVSFAKRFVAGISIEDVNKDWLLSRCHILFGFSIVRWVCIIMNIFLPHHLERKMFAKPGLCVSSLKMRQITEAKLMLLKISENPFQQS